MKAATIASANIAGFNQLIVLCNENAFLFNMSLLLNRIEHRVAPDSALVVKLAEQSAFRRQDLVSL
jgi:hypothetical protein